MAEQTTSSIVVDAPPAAVMAVIADFPAYPEWAKGVTTADVVSSFGDEADGRAREVFFILDVTPIKDEYTLSYEWYGRRPGHLDPGRGQDAAVPGRRLCARETAATAAPR